MTLTKMFIILGSFLLWIFIGELIIGNLIDKKGVNISSFWEWNPLWFIKYIAYLLHQNP